MKGISLWIEFLIYTSFALLALSYVLFYSNIVSSREKTKLDINNIQNTLMDIYTLIGVYKNCGLCFTSVSGRLPDNSYLSLFNNSNIIYVIYYSSYNYTPPNLYVNLTTDKVGNYYRYNFSVITPKYFLNQSNLTIYKDFCLSINVTYGIIFLSMCR